MRQIDFMTNPRAFMAQFGAWLRAHPAEHNVILSMCQMAERMLARGERPDIRFVTQSEDGEPQLAAVQMPPHNLVLSRFAGEDLSALAERMAESTPVFPAIVGPSDVAAAFAEHWTRLTGQKTVEYMDQIIYSLKTVHFPPDIAGGFRLAREDEAPLLSGWMKSFAEGSLPKAEHLSAEEALRKTQDRIAQGSLAVWDVDGHAVAQAGVSGTDNVARVSLVYTPPENRGKGYASAVVARLSQQLLEQGRDMCCLYADARNPVSNSIYRKIGYQFVGRSSLYILQK